MYHPSKDRRIQNLHSSGNTSFLCRHSKLPDDAVHKCVTITFMKILPGAGIIVYLINFFETGDLVDKLLCLKEYGEQTGSI
jgi:hypothetical protein